MAKSYTILAKPGANEHVARFPSGEQKTARELDDINRRKAGSEDHLEMCRAALHELTVLNIGRSAAFVDND